MSDYSPGVLAYANQEEMMKETEEEQLVIKKTWNVDNLDSGGFIRMRHGVSMGFGSRGC